MIFVVLGIVVLFILFVVVSYNGFVTLRNQIAEAFATMDVYLKKRHDLIPNLVSTVKGYAAHESSTFEKVVAARNKATSATTPSEKLESEAALSSTIKSLFVLVESYPTLKADSGFLDLQRQLNVIETDIAQSRKYYNGVVRIFNQMCDVFPKNIIAGIFNFKKVPYFEIEQTERENVKVEF